MSYRAAGAHLIFSKALLQIFPGAEFFTLAAVVLGGESLCFILVEAESKEVVGVIQSASRNVVS